MRRGCAIATLVVAMTLMNSCSWVRSHLVPRRTRAETVRAGQPAREKEGAAGEKKATAASVEEDAQAVAGGIVPTEAQREEAGKLMARMREQEVAHAGDESAGGVVLPPGELRLPERREGEAEQGRDSLPDPAEQRGLRSPGLPKILPMDIDGKMLDS